MMIRQLDDFVEAYEAARGEMGSGSYDLRSFAPPADHPDYCDIVVELIRVDLEQSWDFHRRNHLDHYRSLFADVLNRPECLERVAFEEYRVRRQTGDDVDAASYAERYGISTDHWPRITQQNQSLLSTHSLDSGNHSRAESFALLSETNPKLARRLLEVEHHFPQLGERIGDFQLTSVLGEGAFARVYLARQSGLADRLVALKISAAGNAEPQRLAQLQHTHIVPIYSFHRHGTLQIVCMPYLGHVTLADISHQLRRADTLPVDGQTLADLLASLSTQRLNVTQVVEARECTATVAAYERSQRNERKDAARFANESYVRAVVWLLARVAEGLAHAHEQGGSCDRCPRKDARVTASQLLCSFYQ